MANGTAKRFSQATALTSAGSRQPSGSQVPVAAQQLVSTARHIAASFTKIESGK